MWPGMRVFVCAATLLGTSAAATITGGYVLLDNGVESPDFRGYGRGIAVDLVSTSADFELRGGDADTSRSAPGSVVGGMAFAPTQVDLSRIMLNGRVFSLTMPLSGTSYPAASASILSFDTQPVPLPLPQDLPDPGAFWVTFVLSPAPFTMTGHLSAGEIGGPHQIDLDVEGIGFATMKGAYGRLQGIQEPVYWVWETEFTFVPEAPPAALGIVGIAVIALLRRRRGGWARAGRRQPA